MKHLHGSVLSVHAKREIQTASDPVGYRPVFFQRPLRRLIVASCAVLAFLMLFGCGRKGDPFLSDPVVPSKVRALKAVARPSAIQLSWQAPRDNTDETDLLDLGGFQVYRFQSSFEEYCVSCPPEYELLFDYEYTGPSGQKPEKGLYFYRDTNVEPGSVYTYRMHAYTADGVVGQQAGPTVVYYDSAPGIPQGFTAERKNKLIALNWQPVAVAADGSTADDIAGYSIYRRLDSEEYESPLNDEPVAEGYFDDIPPAMEKVYYYTLRAVRKHEQTVIESDASPEIRVEYYDINPPEAPRFLTAIGQSSGVLLKWMAKTEKGFAGYNIYRRKAGSGEFKRLNSELLKTNSWLDTTAVTRQRYEYAVSAVDDSLSVNESPLSEAVSLRFILN